MGSLAPDQRRRVLFIDAFDSFTNNIVALLERVLNADITITHIDNVGVGQNLQSVLEAFDAVVVGPGPGNPANPEDVGYIGELWTLPQPCMVPVLAICLGFQSLGLACGATVTELHRPHHGIVANISHQEDDIFAGAGDFCATNYHSLSVELNESARRSLSPLAWNVDDEVNGPVLMAIKHVSKPFWGLQFHPESICTSKKAAETLITNWWTAAESWLSAHGRVTNPDRSVVNHLLSSANLNHSITNGTHRNMSHLLDELHRIAGSKAPALRWEKRRIPNISTTQFCEALGLAENGLVLLDSQGHTKGRFSIVGLVEDHPNMKLKYSVKDRLLRYGSDPDSKSDFSRSLESMDSVWTGLKDVLSGFKIDQSGPPAENPFWGGLMGYISYEAGLDSMQIPLHESCSTSKAPDLLMAFVYRSIVIDHKMSSVYIQSLISDDTPWLDDICGKVERLWLCEETSGKRDMSKKTDAMLKKELQASRITRPRKHSYCEEVVKCQNELAAGESYELCLTDESKIHAPPTLDSWELYKKLRLRNAAPFGAFLNLDDVTVVGSSPERFLRWSRNGHIDFRPIKGTVKKSPEMTFDRAQAIINTSKERAENLMIVDLIRHDLSGVVGGHNCWVSQLMVVEEYETVYHLVSAIEGRLPSDKEGIDVLRASLPPGSMTGAPKRRSCEILRDLEKRPRGIYSGVLGYMEVGGGADFSVVIRTAFRNSREDAWRVGAGGAVTIQSDALAEFHEMEVKASSVLATMRPEDCDTPL